MPIQAVSSAPLPQTQRSAGVPAAAAATSQPGAGASTLGQDTLVVTRKAPSMVNHAAFFDTNFDHKITVAETRQGLQDLGIPHLPSVALAPVTNLVLGGALRPAAGASVMDRFKNMFTVDLDTLKSDASKEGGGAPFDPVKKVDMLMSFDTKRQGSLTLDDIGRWLDRDMPGAVNKARTKLGFQQLFSVAADTTQVVTEKGVEKTVPAMSRERLLSFYNGTIFYDVAASRGHAHPLPPTGR